MTTTLAKLKELNEKRTQGRWSPDIDEGECSGYFACGPYHPENQHKERALNDAEFIAALANSATALIEIAERAMEVTDLAVNWPKIDALKQALAALEHQ